MAVMLFGEQEVARFATREQAEWRAGELNDHVERQPRGYVSYLVRPAGEVRRWRFGWKLKRRPDSN